MCSTAVRAVALRVVYFPVHTGGTKRCVQPATAIFQTIISVAYSQVGMESLFVYGTLKGEDILRRLVGRRVEGIDTLLDHSTRMLDSQYRLQQRKSIDV